MKKKLMRGTGSQKSGLIDDDPEQSDRFKEVAQDLASKHSEAEFEKLLGGIIVGKGQLKPSGNDEED